jgi:hypothetical protein
MAERGFRPPEPSVRWLHVEPQGYRDCMISSDLWTYHRHWIGKGPVQCTGRGCPLCKVGYPRQTRYIVKVAADDGDYLLELGGVQAAMLQEIYEDGGVFGARIRVLKPGRTKNSKIELEFLEREKLMSEAEDISAVVRSIEAKLPLPPERVR